MKNITSTIESTTSKNTSSDVLFLKATLYGTLAIKDLRGSICHTVMKFEILTIIAV